MEPDADWLDDVLSRMLDGPVDDATSDALADRLAADPVARQRYLDFIELHAMLHWSTAPAPVMTTAATSRGQRRSIRSSRVRTAAIAAAVLVIAGLLWAIGGGGWPASNRTDGSGVAGVGRSVAVAWRDGEAPLAIGHSLRVGDRVAFERGLLELWFGAGVNVLLQGPVVFEITAPDRGRLESGRLTAIVDASLASFAVDTPQAQVVDLGTEFGVGVDPDSGRSHVEVFDGEVEVSTRGAGEPQRLRLRESEAVTVENGELLPALRGRYATFVRPFPVVTPVPFVPEGPWTAHAWRGQNGDWHDARNWRGGAVPDRDASVRLSQQGFTIDTHRDAQAGEVLIGQARWLIRDCSVDVAGLYGQVEIGGRPDALVEVRNAQLRIATRLILRNTGRIEIASADVVVGSDVFFGAGDAEIVLAPPSDRPSTVVARNLFGMSGEDTLRFAIGERGAGAIRIAELAAIGGHIEFDFDEMAALPRSNQVLLEVVSTEPSLGRFEGRDEGDVVRTFTDGATLRFSYQFAADGVTPNDVALVYHDGD